MDTVKILISGLKANISDQDLFDNLRGRLELGGVLTHELNFERDGDTLIVNLGIFGTISQDLIEVITNRYLNCRSNRQVISYEEVKVVINSP